MKSVARVVKANEAIETLEAPPGLGWQVAVHGCKTSQKKMKETQKKGCVENINLLGDSMKENEIQAVEEVWEWKCLEAAVDTACVDHVVNPKEFLGLTHRKGAIRGRQQEAQPYRRWGR